MTIPEQKKIRIIGGPMDLGADHRGVDMGPSAIRIAGLHSSLADLGFEVADWGNIPVAISEVLPVSDPRIKYLPEVARSNELLADMVESALEEGAIPLVLGGDQAISIGDIAGVTSFYRKQGKKVGVIWFDAHGDMNTPETTPSGNIHGMPFAASLGMGVKELTHIKGFAPKLDAGVCALIGARSIDEGERDNIRRSGLNVFTIRDVDERGIRDVMQEAIEIASDNTAGILVSLDMDFFDPIESPGVGTPVIGGATYREGHLAMEMIADTNRLVAMEVVEVNPVLDTRNRTAKLAVGLVLSAFGRRIM
jgi:arginase